LELAAIALPLIVQGWSGMIYPRPRLIYLVVAPALLSFGLFLFEPLLWLLIGVDAAVLLAIVVDLFTLPRKRLLKLSGVRAASLR
jgi:hypothetical protein